MPPIQALIAVPAKIWHHSSQHGQVLLRSAHIPSTQSRPSHATHLDALGLDTSQLRSSSFPVHYVAIVIPPDLFVGARFPRNEVEVSTNVFAQVVSDTPPNIETVTSVCNERI